jgi:predicted HTH transcriptional regulator
MDMKIADLLRRAEGKTLEFKRDLSSPDHVLRTLIAFANTSGGTLLLGVEDRTRSVRGVEDPLGLEERLANLISDCIIPTLVPTVEFLSWRKTQVLAVEVAQSGVRPYHLKKEGAVQGVYVRVGSTNRRADPALISEMKRSVGLRTYDEEPVVRADSEEIDFRAASESFAPHRKLRPADLETLNLVVKEGRKTFPSVGGILLFGKNPAAHFPDVWLQCGRFIGVDRAKIADTSEHRESLTRLPERGLEFIRKHASKSWEIRGLKRSEEWNVPLPALREAIVNAVVHADYSRSGGPIRVACFDDRIEVESPGLLPFGLQPADMLQGVSVIRNRVIARVFKEIGLIEQWGSGVQRMLSLCREAGLADPVFEEVGFRFRVTFGLKREHKTSYDKKDSAILKLLRDNSDGLSTAAIAKAMALTTRTIRTRLVALKDKGVVAVLGQGKKDPRRKYVLTDHSASRERS